MKVVAIIQARMGSTRLPNKVLAGLAGEPMLARVVRRLLRAQRLDEVLVATTVEPADQPICDLCTARGWLCFRGSAEDVLDRYYRAAEQRQADVVVRITSDCPLIDPGVVDHVVEHFLRRQPGLDYVSNIPIDGRTFPRGLDTEVVSFQALERSWHEVEKMSRREHVTWEIRKYPERFRVESVSNDVDYSAMRWTVDTPEDLEFVSHIIEHFGHDDFSWLEVLALLEQHTDWLEINRQIEQKDAWKEA